MRDYVRGQWRSGLGLFKDPAPPKSGRVSCAHGAYTRARARVYRRACMLVHRRYTYAREKRPFRVRSDSDFSTPCTHTSRPLPTGHRGCTPPSTTGVQLFRVCSNPRRSPALSSGPSFFLLARVYHPGSAPDSRYNGPAFSPFSGIPWGWRRRRGEVLRGRAEQRAETVPSRENSTAISAA